MPVYAVDISREFIAIFCKEHMRSEYDAKIMLVSTFASCFAIFQPEFRDSVVQAILLLASDIGKEKFEDGEDFIDLLRNKIIQHKNEAKSEEGDES